MARTRPMPVAKRSDRMAEMIKEVETMARRLRTDVRRAAREVDLAPYVKRAATMLRKQAALVAAEVERRVHALRLELAKPAPHRPAAKRKAMRAA
jgi:hypothetical protein